MLRTLARGVLRPLLTRLRPGNVAMFHLGRSGSTVLGQLLGQHPRIAWSGELYASIFKEWQRRNGGVETVEPLTEDPIAILRGDMRSALHRFYGFEIKPFHLRLIGCSPEPFLRHLDALGFTHFIVLDRKNRLRKILSSLIAHRDEARYHIGRDAAAQLQRVRVDVGDVRIDFDAKPLVQYLAGYDADMGTLRALLTERRSLALTYEDDVQADPRKAYARVCEFLGIEPVTASVRLARTNPFPVRDMIENFEEVRAALRGTPYEWMLSD